MNFDGSHISLRQRDWQWWANIIDLHLLKRCLLFLTQNISAKKYCHCDVVCKLNKRGSQYWSIICSRYTIIVSVLNAISEAGLWIVFSCSTDKVWITNRSCKKWDVRHRGNPKFHAFAKCRHIQKIYNSNCFIIIIVFCNVLCVQYKVPHCHCMNGKRFTMRCIFVWSKNLKGIKGIDYMLT